MSVKLLLYVFLRMLTQKATYDELLQLLPHKWQK